jgi:hypothetical protein
MPQRSPFEYDVSVSADKARRARRRGMSGAVETSERICEHPHCDRPGSYRAPRAPAELDRWRWFCLDHVREYNASWNFFADCPIEEIEAQQRSDGVWGRPTWPFADRRTEKPSTEAHREGRAWERFGFSDPFAVLGDKATLNPGRAPGDRPAQPALPRNVATALETLGAEATMTRAEIRALYTRLVKSLHPDMNGGDRREEGRLRKVLWAWTQIKESPHFPA